jgi:toxin ParE1/3/4
LIYWEEDALKDREKLFEFLYEFNPVVAERTDDLIQSRVENLQDHPLMGVERPGIPGRLLIIPDVSMLVSYWVDESDIRVMRVLHQKQQFPGYKL